MIAGDASEGARIDTSNPDNCVIVEDLGIELWGQWPRSGNCVRWWRQAHNRASPTWPYIHRRPA